MDAVLGIELVSRPLLLKARRLRQSQRVLHSAKSGVVAGIVVVAVVAEAVAAEIVVVCGSMSQSTLFGAAVSARLDRKLTNAKTTTETTNAKRNAPRALPLILLSWRL